MDHLPLSDIPMLVSSVNFLLRDGEFADLDEICGYYSIERQKLEEVLASAGYAYSEELNKIR